MERLRRLRRSLGTTYSRVGRKFGQIVTGYPSEVIDLYADANKNHFAQQNQRVKKATVNPKDPNSD
jgi:hypothetical protein